MAKKTRPTAQLSPAVRLSALAPQVSSLATQPTDAAFQAELTRLTAGLKPASFLPILVKAWANCAEEQRTAFDAPMVAWLREQQLIELLHDLTAKGSFSGPSQAVARTWLAAAGLEATLPAEVTLAERVLMVYAVGTAKIESQASLAIFWYEDERRRRVATATFLIDFEPPWEGALKDLAFRTFRDPTSAEQEFLAMWQDNTFRPRLSDVATFMRFVWQALRQSQAEDIRLPRDFVSVMPRLMPLLFELPPHPEVAPLTQDELQAMVTSGRSPEQLWNYERQYGYQKRMPDGKILHIMRSPDDDDF